MGKFSETQDKIALALSALSGQLREIGIGVIGLRNVVENNVIATETKKFPASGAAVIERSWQQRFAAICIRNLSATSPITISNTPTQTGGVNTGMEGTGYWVIPAGSKDTINMAGETLTIYGTVGEFVSYQVFSRPVDP